MERYSKLLFSECPAFLITKIRISDVHRAPTGRASILDRFPSRRDARCGAIFDAILRAAAAHPDPTEWTCFIEAKLQVS